MKRIFILCVGLFILGCAHISEKPPTGLTPTQFWAEQANRAAELKAFSGKLTLHFEAKKESVTGQGRVLGRSPGQLRLELRDPLGKLQYLMALNGNQMTAFYPTEKIAYLDNRGGGAYLKEYLGADYSFEDLRDLMVGLIPRSMQNGAKKEFDQWQWRSGRYDGTFKSKDKTITVSVDGESGTLRKLKSESKLETIEVNFSDLMPVKVPHGDRLLVAEIVEVKQKSSGTRIEVNWAEVMPVAQPPNAEVFKVDLPDNVRKIRF